MTLKSVPVAEPVESGNLTAGFSLPARLEKEPRVAVVLTQLGYGGAERQTVELLTSLKATVWEPVVVVCLSEYLRPYGSIVRDLGYPLEVIRRRGSFDLARLASLRNLFRVYHVNLVHGVHLLAAAYSWIACSRGRTAPVIPAFRGGQTDHGLIRAFVYRRMLAASPITLVNSRRGARFLVDQLCARPERVAVVPNGVDFHNLGRIAARPRLRSELGIAQTEPIVGFVGRNQRVKNVPRFLEVARRLLQRVPRLHIVVVGSGLDESVRVQLAPTLPTSHTHFLGPREDVPALLKEMDVLVITSDSEGCPNVALEALGLGVPVVSADVGDVAHMVAAAQHGTVVSRHDLDGYVQSTLKYLSSRRERPGEAPISAELERHYSLESMVAHTVQLWQTLLNKHKA
jgi:glycosyltransferase involved in cell wall biosynthesis